MGVSTYFWSYSVQKGEINSSTLLHLRCLFLFVLCFTDENRKLCADAAAAESLWARSDLAVSLSLSPSVLVMLGRPVGCLCVELGVCEREIRMYVTHQLLKCPLFPDIGSVCVSVCVCVCVCVCAGVCVCVCVYVQETKRFFVQPNVERRHSYMRETETNITFGNTDTEVTV